MTNEFNNQFLGKQCDTTTSPEENQYLLMAIKYMGLAAGVEYFSIRHAQGTLVDSIMRVKNETKILIITHPEKNINEAFLYNDRYAEKIIHIFHRSILFTPDNYVTPEHFLIYVDNSSLSHAFIEMVAKNTLLKSLTCHLVTVINESINDVDAPLSWAKENLIRAGFTVIHDLYFGSEENDLTGRLENNNSHLLVLGNHNDLRMHHLLLQAQADHVLNINAIPLLLLRE